MEAGEELLLYVLCVSWVAFEDLGWWGGWAVPALTSACRLSPVFSSPHTPWPCARHCPLILPLPSPNQAAAPLSGHTGSEERSSLRRASAGSIPSPSREGEMYKAFLPALGSFQVVWGLAPSSGTRGQVSWTSPRGGRLWACCSCCSSGLFCCQEMAGEGKDLRLGLIKG